MNVLFDLCLSLALTPRCRMSQGRLIRETRQTGEGETRGRACGTDDRHRRMNIPECTSTVQICTSCTDIHSPLQTISHTDTRPSPRESKGVQGEGAGEHQPGHQVSPCVPYSQPPFLVFLFSCFVLFCFLFLLYFSSYFIKKRSTKQNLTPGPGCSTSWLVHPIQPLRDIYIT